MERCNGQRVGEFTMRYMLPAADQRQEHRRFAVDASVNDRDSARYNGIGEAVNRRHPLRCRNGVDVDIMPRATECSSRHSSPESAARLRRAP